MSDGEDLVNRKYHLLKDFSTLLFDAESARTVPKAWALASFLTSRRLADNSPCLENAHFDALRTAHEIGGAAGDDVVADMLRTSKNFEFDANHDFEKDFLRESHRMAALAKIRHSSEERNLSSLLGQPLIDHTNGEKVAVTRQGGATAQVIDMTLSENPGRLKTRALRSVFWKSDDENDGARASVLMEKHGKGNPLPSAPAGPSEKGQESPFSSRTLELLGGPDGDLSEEIQKLDPNLVETICSEMMDVGGAVRWDNIAGLEAAKQLVQEQVVWPVCLPHLYQGARTPRGLLLFGPPGTGKTMIGKAIASDVKSKCLSISASSLMSKWTGEGGKLVKTLFALSACTQPAVIFIDEIDSILSARKSEGEHEASRRLKAELLSQMEGCSTNSAGRRVLLVGATNRPEELDEAARRWMPKQLYIPLPCGEARKQMILRQLEGVKASLSDVEVTRVVERTLGYSGSDIENLVQEACQGPVRDRISNILKADLRPVKIKDFQVAARAQKPSVGPDEVFRHESYNEKHGSKCVVQEDEELEDDW